jgi:hypothetical protein
MLGFTMIKVFIPAALLAASLVCSAAHAVQEDIRVPQPQVSQAQQLSSDPAVQRTPGLTRKQVYDQLVLAENDGSLGRLDATLYKGQ